MVIVMRDGFETHLVQLIQSRKGPSNLVHMVVR